MATFQSLMVPSRLAEASVLESGVKATPLAHVCSLAMIFSRLTSNRMMPPAPDAAIRLPSVEKLMRDIFAVGNEVTSLASFVSQTLTLSSW